MNQVLEWVKSTCPTYITNDYAVLGGRTDAETRGNDYSALDFFFYSGERGEQDMMMFALRWVA